MKQDNLEKFIIENREEFDVFEPGAELWDRIHKPAPRVIRMNWKTVITRVAAVIVIFVASYFFHDVMQNRISDQTAVSTQNPENEEQNNLNMLMEAEMFYTSQINSAKEEIILLSGNDKELIEDIHYDLAELEKIFSDLKNDLKDNSDNEEVIEAMIQNYRIKLQVLEEVLLQLKKTKNTEHEKSTGNEI